MLVLRSPREDPLSSKRVKRRVQLFVLLAIAVFLSGGIAARSLWKPQDPPGGTAPARDFAVVPSPEGSTTRPSAPARPTAGTRRSDATRPVPRPIEKGVAVTRRATPRATLAQTAARPAVPSKVTDAESAAVRLTNVERALHGCSALRIDVRLRSAARAHSVDMHRRDYFDHNSPDGRTPWDRIKAAGYADPGAENIAKGYATAQAVVQGWMNSPGHRANILNCKLTAVGIGVEFGAGGPWWTQDFGYR